MVCIARLIISRLRYMNAQHLNSFKQPSARSVTMITHNSSTAGDLRLLPSTLTGRLLGPSMASQRVVVPEWRPDTSSQNLNVKHSAQTVLEDKLPGIDFQRQYEKLEAKAKKRDEKSRKLIKDLQNQIIVKDSIINSFEQEISTCRSGPDLDKMSAELESLRRAFSQLEKRNLLLERGAEANNSVPALRQENAALRRRIDEVGQPDMHGKDLRILELQGQLNRLCNILRDSKKQLEAADIRLLDTQKSHEQILKSKDRRILQLQEQVKTKSQQVSSLIRKAQQVPALLSTKLQEAKLQHQKLLQLREQQLNENQSERKRLAKQYKEARTQLEALNQQLSRKNEQFERIVRREEQRAASLEDELKALRLQQQAQGENRHQGLHWQAMYKDILQTNGQLQHQINSKNSRLESLESQFANTLNQLNSRSIQHELLQSQIQELRQQLQIKQTVQNDLQHRLQAALSNQTSLSQLSYRSQQLQKQLKSKQCEVLRLQSTLSKSTSSSNQTILTLQQAVQQSSQQLSQLTSQLNQKSHTISVLQQKLISLEPSTKKMEEQLNLVSRQVKEYEQSVESLHRAVSEHKEAREMLEKEVARKEIVRAAFEADVLVMMREVELAHQRVTEKDAQITGLSDNINRLQEKINFEQLEHNKEKSRVQQLKLESQSSQRSVVSSLQFTINSLQAELTRVKRDCQSRLQILINENAVNIASLTRHLQQYQQLLSIRQQQLQGKNSQVMELQARLHEHQHQLERRSDSQRELASQLATAQGIIQMTQSTQGLQLEEVLKDNERMKEALRSNDQEVDGLRREMARVADEMRAEVREVEQEFAGKLQQAKEQLKVATEKHAKQVGIYEKRLNEAMGAYDQFKISHIEELTRLQRQAEHQVQQLKLSERESQQFIKLQDHIAMLKDKQQQIKRLQTSMNELQAIQRSQHNTPPIACQSPSKYLWLLSLLQVPSMSSEQFITQRINSLLNTYSRYEQNMSQLMSKIQWMEQNLGVLNQENTDFHSELAAKDAAIAELTKQLSSKDKVVGDSRHYEGVLAKRLQKAEELLEHANKAIFAFQMRELARRLQQNEQL